MRRRITRISVPIVLGTIAVPMTVAILVGWTIVVARSTTVTGAWLLVLGIVSLSIILAVLVLLSLFLVREVLAAQRQFGFIDSVTHELNSPLAALKLGLETLRRPDLPRERSAEVLGMMLADVDRLSGFIGDVLQTNRMVHDARMSLVEVGVLDVAQRVLLRIERRHAFETTAVRLDIDPSLRLKVDAVAFDTILTNLLDNAVKYSDGPPVVVIEARRQANRLELSVCDQGIGLEKRQTRRVFERFYRVESEEVRRRSGTGLGLYVAQVMTRAMGGRLTLDSAGPGLGATARLHLPGVVS